MTKFWMVIGERSHSTTYRHATKQLAEAEACRLARANHGERFIVLEAVSAVGVADLRWVMLTDRGEEEVPF